MGYFEGPVEEQVVTRGSLVFMDPSTWSDQLGAMIATQTASGVTLSGAFAGLEPSTSTHWHAFAGDCENMGQIFAHFDIEVDDAGFATIEGYEIEGVHLQDIEALEVSNDSGRYGCGPFWDAVGTMLDPYDGFEAEGAVAVIDHCDPCHIHLNGAVGGLDSGSHGLIKIHEGSSCSDLGDTYKFTYAYDPWANETWVADEHGSTQINVFGDVFTADKQYPVQGRAVVVYSDDSVPMACGVLNYKHAM